MQSEKALSCLLCSCPPRLRALGEMEEPAKLVLSAKYWLHVPSSENLFRRVFKYSTSFVHFIVLCLHGGQHQCSKKLLWHSREVTSVKLWNYPRRTWESDSNHDQLVSVPIHFVQLISIVSRVLTAKLSGKFHGRAFSGQAAKLWSTACERHTCDWRLFRLPFRQQQTEKKKYLFILSWIRLEFLT